jgi:hypothetical protein
MILYDQYGHLYDLDIALKYGLGLPDHAVSDYLHSMAPCNIHTINPTTILPLADS